MKRKIFVVYFNPCFCLLPPNLKFTSIWNCNFSVCRPPTFSKASLRGTTKALSSRPKNMIRILFNLEAFRSPLTSPPPPSLASSFRPFDFSRTESSVLEFSNKLRQSYLATSESRVCYPWICHSLFFSLSLLPHICSLSLF